MTKVASKSYEINCKFVLDLKTPHYHKNSTMEKRINISVPEDDRFAGSAAASLQTENSAIRQKCA